MSSERLSIIPSSTFFLLFFFDFILPETCALHRAAVAPARAHKTQSQYMRRTTEQRIQSFFLSFSFSVDAREKKKKKKRDKKNGNKFSLLFTLFFSFFLSRWLSSLPCEPVERKRRRDKTNREEKRKEKKRN